MFYFFGYKMDGTSFMQRMTAVPSMHNVFKNLLNPSNATHGTQIIAVHGEHVPGKKTHDHGIKFVLSFLASSGTVNWANESVNQAAVAQYNTILDNPGFAPYKRAILSGDASLIPTSIKHIDPPPKLDELYLALAFRVSIELEFIDDEHRARQQPEYKMRVARSLREMLMVSDDETGFTDATKSRERNFSTTLPVHQTSGSSPRSKSGKSGSLGSPRSKSGKSGSPGSPRSKSGFVDPMIIEELMAIMRIPFKGVTKDTVTLDRLKAFVDVTSKYGIVLPTRGCLEKRYSLTARYESVNENEHESLMTTEEGLIVDKGYEHKLCLLIPYTGTEGAYARHISSFENAKYRFENTMHGSEIVGHSAHVSKHLKTEFNATVTPNFNHSRVSTQWNKCVIAPRDPADKDIGFFQWKIVDLGGERHLVVNIWNLISRLEGTMGTMKGGIFISTTSETLQMCKLMGLQYVTGIDLTCVVPGMRSAGWVVLDKNSWEDEVRDVDSQIAHVHFIDPRESARERVSAKDMRRNICKQLESVDKILDMFNGTGHDAAKISKIADATLKTTTHGTNYVHDEMFTMYYFFKGITSGPEKDQLAAKPPDSVLVPIYRHLIEIEKILVLYKSSAPAEQATMMEKYKENLRGILSLVKDKITIASFKVRPEPLDIAEYTALVEQFIELPKSLKELVLEGKLKEFTDIVKTRLVVLGEDPAKITRFITEIERRVKTSKPGPRNTKKGGKRNKTRKYRRGLRKRSHTRRRL